MKKRKRIVALGLAISIVLGIGSVAVFAASSATGSINGYTTKGVSSIGQKSASAYTSYGTSGQVSVNSKYSYVNTDTLSTGIKSQNNGHYNYAQVNFTAPTNCHSVKIESSHTVSASNQTWTAKTSKVY